MKTKKPKVSVIIPTYNHLDDCLKPCLESMIKYSDFDLIDAEILIVANGCTDNTKEYVESFGEPFKLIWFDDKLGYTKATNEGIKRALGEYIILLNNDTEIVYGKNDWINKLIEPFENGKHEKPGISGCHIIYSHEVSCKFVVFFCACIPKKVINEIGLLDEIFSPGFGEDIDYCMRLKQAGYEMINANTNEDIRYRDYPIWHKAEKTFHDKDHKEDYIKNVKRNQNILKKRYKKSEFSFKKNDIEKDYLSVIYNDVIGMFEEQDMYTYREIARKIKDGIIIEVGSYAGRSALSIADICRENNNIIYCIDNWMRVDIQDGPDDYAETQFLNNIERFGYKDIIIPIKSYSELAVNYFIENNIKADLVFIDASHDYKSVMIDLKNWPIVLKENGILCGHDIIEWPDVEKALKDSNIDYEAKNNIWIRNNNLKNKMIKNPKVSVIIPTYNHLDDCLKPCLESIKKYSDFNAISIEILVVANGCTDNTKEYVESLGEPFKLIWFDDGLGYIKATNEGIKRSLGDYVILLNNDTEIINGKNDWINRLIEPFENGKYKKPGISGCHIIRSYETFCQFVIFFCACIPKKVIEEIGLLDEIFSPGYYEDVDYCMRLQQAGYEIANVNIKNNDYPIWHKSAKTFSGKYQKIRKRNQQILKERYRKVRFYDCFMFNNELDLLEIRLHELTHLVDKFVLVESNFTFSGKSKKLYYEENKERFSEFHNQIIHIVVDTSDPFLDNWGRENAQRESIMNGLVNCNDNDIIIISDVDEIPKKEKILQYNPSQQLACLELDFFYYYFNNKNIHEKWYNSKVATFGLINRLRKEGHNLSDIRNLGSMSSIIHDAGWHFSFLGDEIEIINKIESYSHQEYNNDYYKNTERIKKMISEGKDIFERNNYYKIIKINNNFPKHLLFNTKKFKKLIASPNHIDGWFTEENIDAYREMASKIKNGIIIEIGSYLGRSALSIADICKENNNIIYCVDNWLGINQKGTDKYCNIQSEGLYESFINNIERFDYQDIIIPIKQDSELAVNYFIENNIKADMVFIDTSHDYESVMIDLKNWPIVLKENGILSGHDIDFPDVVKALEDSNIEYNVKSTIWIKHDNIKNKNYIETSEEISSQLQIESTIDDSKKTIIFDDISIEKYKEMASKITNGIIIEIGYNTRKLALSIADILRKNNNIIYCVSDYKINIENETNENNIAKPESLYESFVDDLIKLGYQDIIKPIKYNFELAVNYFIERNIKADIIFINMPYYYDSVMTYIDKWKPILKENGILSKNDFSDDLKNDYIKSNTWSGSNNLKDITNKNIEVTAVISTKDRYFDTLPLALESVARQTYKPKKIIIFDDGEHKDIRKESLYANILAHIEKKGIKWQVIFGEKKGQVFNHQKSINMSDTEWIWRIDDDEIAEPNVLEQLVSNINDSVGAIGGLVLDPKNELNAITPKQEIYNKISEINSHPNIQWTYHDSDDVLPVEHLYSSFLFRKEAAIHGYCLSLSQVGHREETIFTHEMKRNGWELLVDPKAITWHYRSPTGGIRSYQDVKLWEHDEEIFHKKIEIWNNNIDKQKIIVLNNGMGDHIAFSMILSEVLEKYPEVTLAVCYPEVFEDFNVKLMSIKESMIICNNSDRYNIYKWMTDNKWNKHIVDAYREMIL